MTTREHLDDIESALGADLVTLTDWETNFIDSVNDLPNWSDKQKRVIKRIWDRIEA